MKKKNIILIGFSGCGKTTLGWRLSLHLEWEFIDTDVLIEDETHMTIPEIFQTYGEEYFRKKEQAVIREISRKENCVIATGGGCIKSEENMSALKETGLIIYIKATPSKIYANIKHNTTRPLLQVEDKLGAITDLMESRIPLYEKYADRTVNVSRRTRERSVRALYDTVRAYLDGVREDVQ